MNTSCKTIFSALTLIHAAACGMAPSASGPAPAINTTAAVYHAPAALPLDSTHLAPEPPMIDSAALFAQSQNFTTAPAWQYGTYTCSFTLNMGIVFLQVDNARDGRDVSGEVVDTNVSYSATDAFAADDTALSALYGALRIDTRSGHTWHLALNPATLAAYIVYRDAAGTMTTIYQPGACTFQQ